MSKIYDAPFPQNPKNASPVFKLACVIGTENNPTNTQLLFTAGEEGAVLTGLWAIPRGVVPAVNGLYLFISTNGGVDKFLIDSEVMPAFTTFNGGLKIPKTKFAEYSELSALRLQAGAQLYGGIGVASTPGIVMFAQESEYDDPA